MKSLLLAALLVATTVQMAVADYTDGVYHNVRDLNDTNVCFDGIFNHTLLETNTSGWVYNSSGCQVEANSYVNISGMALPVLYQGVPVIPVGFNFEHNTVGAGSALVLQGPLSYAARMVMPWFVEIIGNTFERDAQLRFIGSVPINSTITISQNILDVYNANPYLTDSLDRVVGISVGGNLTTAFEYTSMYHNSHISITENVISVDAAAANKFGAGIRVFTDIYFTDKTTVTINRNKITAACGFNKECFGFDTHSYLTLPEGYADSWATLDENSFAIKNGRGFVVPQVWAPNATFYASASRNTVTIALEESARTTEAMSEHAFTIQDTSAGAGTRIDVCQNVVTSIGNSMIFFAGALDITENAVFNCSWNDIFTTTGDPTVYFIDQTSLTDHATLAIDHNRFQRQDNVRVTRPYLGLTYDLAILGYSQFSFSSNECYPKNVAQGPYLATLTDGRVLNVGPTAFFSICNNVYNGNPADLLRDTVLTANLRRFVNCNARYTTTVGDTTTKTPVTTKPTTTAPAQVQNQSPAATVLVAAFCAVAAALAIVF